MPSFSTSVVLALSAASLASANVHGLRARNHNEIAKRAEEHLLSKRFYSPRVTWYPTNTGPDACTGQNHGDYDALVAINTAQWNNGAICGKRIRITANGKTAEGVISDLCASCPEHGQIDVTKGLFQRFASLDKGIFTATWEFVDGSGGGGNPAPPKPPKPSPPKPTPKPDPPKPNPPKPNPPKPDPKPTPPKEVPPPPKPSKSKSFSSSSVKPSPPAVPSSPVVPSVSLPVVPPAVPSAPVGNAGAGPTEGEDSTASIQGGISSDDTLPGNGAASISLNKFVAAVAAIILAAQAL